MHTLFKTQTLKTIPCSAVHTRLGHIKVTPSPSPQMKLSLTRPVGFEAFRHILETLTGDACAVHLSCFLIIVVAWRDTALDFMPHATIAAHWFHILVRSEGVSVKRLTALLMQRFVS